MKNVVVDSFGSFNWRRYSRPWVCRMTERGGYDFNANVGTYTGAERVFPTHTRDTAMGVKLNKSSPHAGGYRKGQSSMAASVLSSPHTGNTKL